MLFRSVVDSGEVSIVGAGTATITITAAETANYLSSEVSVTITVVKKDAVLTVTKMDYEVTYGEDDPELTWTAEGLVNGDSLTGITVTREAGNDAGSYAIKAAQEAGANPNYDVTLVDGTMTIEPKNISDAVVELGDALIANGETQTQEIKSVTVTNNKGDILEVTYEVTGNTGKEPGVYTMAITGTGNFTGTITHSFVIAPAADSDMATNDDGDVVIGDGTIGLEVQQETGVSAVETGTDKEEMIEILVESGELTAEELAWRSEEHTSELQSR